MTGTMTVPARVAAVAAALAVGLLASGCSGDESRTAGSAATNGPGSGTTTGPGTGSTADPGATPPTNPQGTDPASRPPGSAGSKSPGPAGPEAVARFHKTGGIAGVDEQVLVGTDGFVIVTGRKARCTVRISAAELRDLRVVLDRVDFNAIRAGKRVADGFTYLIGYQGRTASVTGTTVPADLRPAVAIFDKLAKRCGG